jgi:hypothetical protein
LKAAWWTFPTVGNLPFMFSDGRKTRPGIFRRSEPDGSGFFCEFAVEFFFFGGLVGIAFVAGVGVVAFVVPLQEKYGPQADHDKEKKQLKCDHGVVSGLGFFFDEYGLKLTEVTGFSGFVLKVGRDIFMDDAGNPVGSELKQ